MWAEAVFLEFFKEIFKTIFIRTKVPQSVWALVIFLHFCWKMTKNKAEKSSSPLQTEADFFTVWLPLAPPLCRRKEKEKRRRKKYM